MPRPGRNVPEKSKDFFGSMKRLLSNLKPWRVIMILALVLAMVSAILSLIAPNKLSDFTDTISKGLIPKTEKLEEISTKMASNLSEEKLNENFDYYSWNPYFDGNFDMDRAKERFKKYIK